MTALSLDGDSPRSATTSITRGGGGTTTRDDPPPEDDEEELIAQQQSAVQTFISNLGQSLDLEGYRWPIGTQFTTGPKDNGYVLRQVTHHVGLRNSGKGVLHAVLHADNGGEPGTELYAFPDATYTNVDRQAITNTGAVLLEPNTKYWVVISEGPGNIQDIKTSLSSSNNVDSGAQAGWELADISYYKFGTDWRNYSGSPVLGVGLGGSELGVEPTTDEYARLDFPMDASTLGRLRIGTTSTGTLDSVDDNLDALEHTESVPRGDLIKIEGLTPGHSYRVRAWFGTSKEDSATAARGGAIGLQFSRSGIELASLSPHNDNLLDDGRASFVFPAFANDEYYVDVVAPAFRPPDGSNPAYTYYGPYMLEVYDLGVTQRLLGVTGQTCDSDNKVCTGGTVSYSEGYGIKATNICVNNRCYNVTVQT